MCLSLFKQNKSKAWFPRVYPLDDPNEQSLVEYREWYATIVDFDPVPFLQKSEIPVFWIFGDPELDQLGPVSKSIERINNLKTHGKNFEVHQYDGQGHNVKEKYYEESVYNWLISLHGARGYKFKKH